MIQRKMTFCSMFIMIILVAIPFAASYGNTREGKSFTDEYEESFPSEIIELSKCYSSLNKIKEGTQFEDYYEDFKQLGLPTECKEKILKLGDQKKWYVYKNDSGMDSDQDIFTDLEEETEGTDKNDEMSYPWWIDIDGDGYTNDYELSTDSDPLDMLITPNWKDTDHDGYGDDFEVERQSDPNNADSVPAMEVKTPTITSKSINWNIYLLIGVGIILILSIISYVLYSLRKE